MKKIDGYESKSNSSSAEAIEQSCQRDIKTRREELSNLGFCTELVAIELWSSNTINIRDETVSPEGALTMELDFISSHAKGRCFDESNAAEEKRKAALDLMIKYGCEASLALRMALDCVRLDLPLVSRLDHIDLKIYRDTINPEVRQGQIEIETKVRQDIDGAWKAKLAQRFPEGADVRMLAPDVPTEFMFVNAKMISEGKDPYYTVENLYLPEDMVGGAESETQCAIREIWNSIIEDAAVNLITASSSSALDDIY